jgi:putative aldouronate transport system permease protein
MAYKSLIRKVIAQRYLLLMLLPTLAVLTIFTYRPITGWVIAFTDYRIGQNIWEGNWVGLRHFREVFLDGMNAMFVFRNTLVINLLSISITLTCAMLFSILINEIRLRKVKSVVQTFSLLPYFISWVITYALFQTFFSANTGLANAFLVQHGVLERGINLLGAPEHAWTLMTSAYLWKMVGYNMVIFLATIAGIDQELYEAASIDGAGRYMKIRYITLPYMSGTLAVLLVLNSGWIFSNNFSQFYQFTTPTNRPMMEVFDTYIYRFGLGMGRFSYASVVSIFRTSISFIMLLIANFAYRKLADRTIF